MEEQIKSENITRSENPHSKLVENPHYVVAIGASAGGLEAIHNFFDNMPENSNVSFVIIQHLSPDYKSLLVELIAKHTHMQVFEAEHNMQLLKNCIYVIPNNKLMTLKGNKLQLTNKSLEKAPNTAVDTFFTSLAEEKGAYSVCVVLSGTGTDGSRGIESVKNAGGLVMVQDPSTAKFDGMPNSAIATGLADFILAPSAMPQELFEYIDEVPIHILNNGKIDEKILEEVFRLVYLESGHDFHFYKTPTIIRRIARRVIQGGFKKLDKYIEFLKGNPDEVRFLAKDFLIGVTKFFRDKQAFDFIYEEIFPAIVNSKNDGEIIKIWTAACSTGEEAYSVAILLDKYLKEHGRYFDVKIFATDLDAGVIDIASKGVYNENIENDIDKETLDNYFTKEGNQYTIVPRIRKQIVFAKHNIIKDPPFIKNDFTSCRNMLIYMNPGLQRKVISVLHFSLNLNGFLFLGPSESVANMKDYFEEWNSKHKIYKKTGNARMDGGAMIFKSENYVHAPQKTRSDKSDMQSSRPIANDFRELIVEEFGYAGFYVDSNYEIKESTGDYKRYLSLPEKKLHLNILKMLPSELSIAVNTAIRKAIKQDKKIHLKNIKVKEKNKLKYYTVTAKPGIPYTLVVLGEGRKEGLETTASLDFSADQNAESNKYILELEADLKQARLDLQMAIEGLESTNEELQSSNEELLSANEELQSSNEELQSLNEELHTLNTEHQLKIKELIDLNDDLNNYFRSTDIGQIFLDARMRIRKFNPAAVRLVNLIDTDLGRPVADISTNIRYEGFISDIRYVMTKGEIIERELQLNNGKSILLRILPYVRQDKQADGVVVSFVDISTLKNLDSILKAVFNASESAIMVFRTVKDEKDNLMDLQWIAGNYASDELLQMQPHMYMNQNLLELVPQLEQNEVFRKYFNKLKNSENFYFEHLFTYNNSERWFNITATKITEGFVITISDITDRKLAEQKLQNNYSELEKVNEELESSNIELQQFASVASHDLKEPLRKIHMFSNILKERYHNDQSDPENDYLVRIIASSARMTTLVNDLLTFSRLSVNHLFRPTDLNQIVKEILSDLEMSIIEKEAQVSIDHFPEIEAVPGQMRQVFQNILSNALKFSRPGVQLRIEMKCELIGKKTVDAPVNPNGRFVRITVTDNGIGFDEQYKDKIFTIFQRLHSKEKYDGTGIGLAITKKIIDKHNGIITAKSQEGAGSTFIVILPVKQ